VPEAGRPREPVENHGRACTQVLFLREAELGFVHILEIGDRPAGTFHHRISSLLKTGSFRQVRELKIQWKNPGNQVIPKLRKRRHRNPLFGHMGDEISKKRKTKVHWASTRHETQFNSKLGAKLSLPCPFLS
jgi:hypothetical protein